MPDTTTYESLSAVLKRQVQSLKKPITELANKFGVVRESLKDTAPRVMRLFNQIKAAHDDFSFVEFARFFAPDLPTHAADRDGTAGYRNHKVYYTLDYMRRMSTQRPRGQRGVRETATDALARSISTLLAFPGVDAEAVWGAVQKEFGYGERVMTGLRRRVEATKPLFEVQRRGTAIKVGNVIHMEPARAALVARGAAATEVEGAMAEAQQKRKPGRPRKVA